MDAVGRQFEPYPYRRMRLQAGGAALVVWPGMLFPVNRRGLWKLRRRRKPAFLKMDNFPVKEDAASMGLLSAKFWLSCHGLMVWRTSSTWSSSSYSFSEPPAVHIKVTGSSIASSRCAVPSWRCNIIFIQPTTMFSNLKQQQCWALEIATIGDIIQLALLLGIGNCYNMFQVDWAPIHASLQLAAHNSYNPEGF